MRTMFVAYLLVISVGLALMLVAALRHPATTAPEPVRITPAPAPSPEPRARRKSS